MHASVAGGCKSEANLGAGAAPLQSTEVVSLSGCSYEETYASVSGALGSAPRVAIEACSIRPHGVRSIRVANCQPPGDRANETTAGTAASCPLRHEPEARRVGDR